MLKVAGLIKEEAEKSETPVLGITGTGGAGNLH